jgi:hypothetical protein
MNDRNQVSVLLGVCIVPQVIAEVKQSCDTPEEAIIREFYASQVFDKLQNPSTGLWHLSPKILAEMFLAEQQGQEVEFPEEQS